MKRAVSDAIETLSSDMSSYVAMFAFELMNLCIKAETGALVPIKVDIDGEEKNIDEVATCAIKDDYTFWVVPTYDDDIPRVCKAIAKLHPEFKQKFTTMTVETPDVEKLSLESTEKEMTVIELEMPEVNDDRYDYLKEGLDFFYDSTKTAMNAAVTKAYATITVQGIGDSVETLDEAKSYVEKIKSFAEEQRDKLYSIKQQEIEDAHNKWLSEVGAKSATDNIEKAKGSEKSE